MVKCEVEKVMVAVVGFEAVLILAGILFVDVLLVLVLTVLVLDIFVVVGIVSELDVLGGISLVLAVEVDKLPVELLVLELLFLLALSVREPLSGAC